MIARISTHFACTEAALCRKIIAPESLQFVASPILCFVPEEAGAMDGEWIGRLSPAIWLFAHIFYRHRQRRWKLLLEGPFGLGQGA